MDLLGSILDSMDKPPVVNDAERIRLKKVKDALAKQKVKEKERLKAFRERAELKFKTFITNTEQAKLEFPVLDRIFRTIIHEIAEDNGLVAYSFGQEGIDRYIVVYKKDYIPIEDELNALRNGEEWNEEKAKQLAEKKRAHELEEKEFRKTKDKPFIPHTDYKEKYQHIIGLEAAKEAARKTETNAHYGFVPSENKKDLRSIEQTLADIQNKKKFKKDTETTS